MLFTTQLPAIALSGIPLALGIDILVASIAIFLLYRGNAILSFSLYSLLLFNVIVMILCIVLFRLEISVGTGIGLFAVLAMLRFRSEVLKLKEMFYLLLLIAIAIVHASFPMVLSFSELILVDILIVAISLLVSTKNSKLYTVKITLDNIDLIKPENKLEIQKVLEKRMGCHVMKYVILDINLTRNKVDVMAVVNQDCLKNKKSISPRKHVIDLMENGQSTGNKILRHKNIMNF